MIDDIKKNYNDAEFNTFKAKYPKRYKELCKILGKFMLSNKIFNLGIDLPFNEDLGSVVAIYVKYNQVTDCRYF